MLCAMQGLSTELGAFVAGVMMSATEQQENTLHQLEPLKQFFLSLFICSTGLIMSPKFLAQHLRVLAGGLVVTVLSKTVLVRLALLLPALCSWCTECPTQAARSVIMVSHIPSEVNHDDHVVTSAPVDMQISVVVYMFKYPARTALAVGLSMAQIGEFAFVLLSVASQLGLLPYQVYMLLMGAPIQDCCCGNGCTVANPPKIRREQRHACRAGSAALSLCPCPCR